MEMSTTAEELTEHVKGIPCSSSLSALFVLFDSFGAAGIVDFAQFWVREDFVCFADLGEFPCGGVIVGILIGMVLFREAAVGLFEVAF